MIEKLKLTQALLDEIAEKMKVMEDAGRHIAAGFEAYKVLARTAGQSEDEIDAMRVAFMAGAEMMFNRIIAIMDDGDPEPTAENMTGMEMLHHELLEWREFAVEHYGWTVRPEKVQ